MEAGRKLVRRVQIKKMDECENGLAALLVQPRLGCAGDKMSIAAVAHGEAVALCSDEEDFAGERRKRFETEGAVVGIEALTEAELALEEHAADECRGLISMVVEHAGESHQVRRHVLGVFFDAVLKRVSGSEQRCMRWQSERHLRFGRGKERAVLGERINSRSGDAMAAVCGDTVGAQ